MPGRLKMSFADYGSGAAPLGERSRTMVHFETIDIDNFALQDTQIDAFVSAVRAVSLCKCVEVDRSYQVDYPEAGPATDPDAQREDKWLVMYHDTTTKKKYRMLIPGCDRSLLATNSEQMDMTKAEAIALVGAIEGFVTVGDDYDHDVLVDAIIFVGRNL
jgi:hypothetical protein